MIRFDEVSLSYQGESLLEGISFALNKGERLGVVGRNGSGKTTLFRLIAGDEVPDSGSLMCTKGYRIGLLRQHSIFERRSVFDEALLGLQDKEHTYKAEAVLFGLGFQDDDLTRSPHELSGGYQLRLRLARLLLEEPDCLLLDEPTNYLDIVSIRWLYAFLRQFRGECILISHDRSFLDGVTTHIMGIHRKRVRKILGKTEEYYAQILQEEEVHERTRLNLLKKKEHMESFIERFGAKASKASQAQSRMKMVEKLPSLHQLAALSSLSFRFQEASFMGKRMIDTEDISFSFKDPLFSNLSLSVDKGDRFAFIGKNGRGKSTFLRLLAQELSPHSGTIRLSDHLRLGYFGQTNKERLDPEKSVFQEISCANPLLNTTEVHAICGLMMFSGQKADKKTALLSGGEKSRVLLGKIVATPCNLLLLDEPTHHLDMESIEALIAAIEMFEGAVVLVTHNEHILSRYNPNKILLFQEGEQSLFLGNYEEFLEKKGWIEEKNPSKEKKKVSLQQEKQERAEQMRLKSQALKPIEKAIQQMEGEIALLEQEQQKETDELIEASSQNHSSRIQSLSKSLAQRADRIDQAYDRLDQELSKKEAILEQYETKYKK